MSARGGRPQAERSRRQKVFGQYGARAVNAVGTLADRQAVASPFPYRS